MTRIVNVNPIVPEKSVIAEAARAVLSGGVIVYPTETLYGIGADARNPAAIAKVVRAKKRRDAKPILVIVHSTEILQQLIAEIPSSANRLMEELWPGPLTIVFKATNGLPDDLTGGSGTIGVRIPSSPFCLELLRSCNCPLTSTSANIAGEPVHRTIPEIERALNEGIDLFVDAGTLPVSKPSTVVSVVEKNPKLIREGVITFDTLQELSPSIQR